MNIKCIPSTVFLIACLALTSGLVNAQSVVDSIPSIPKNATVITAGGQNGSQIDWVNPSVDFGISWGGFTIFAEPGSFIENFNCDDSASNLVYLKPGAFYTALPRDIVVHVENFDYTNAPPNPAHPSSSVKNDLTSLPLTLSPNPTGGMLSVQGLPSDNLTVSVFNTLGETVMEQKNPSAPDFTLDLSKLVPGVYYIRFSSANSVVTKAIIKN
jgi:Secretion system C-terminal sorting domain